MKKRSSTEIELEIESINSMIASIERRILQLKEDYEKYSYSAITANGTTYRKGLETIENEIKKAEEEKRRLEGRLQEINSELRKDIFDLNNKKSGSEKITDKHKKFREAQDRWKETSAFYKLIHYGKRPEKIEWTDMSTYELDSLYRR